MTRVTLLTANTPGAVAILQLHGSDVVAVLSKLTGRADWPERRAVLCEFAGIDEGLAIRINSGAAQLMPHGGLRVVQKQIELLTQQLGCVYDPSPDTSALYPEAQSPIEADMLDAIARAASPAAIDLLAQQPALWAGQLKRARLSREAIQKMMDRSRILDRLIVPPTVVVVGPPNAGKSTLTNALMGRAVSLVADLPGTTRDWVGALVELDVQTDPQFAHQSIAVHWLDTPGLRASDDAIEQRAIALAGQQIERADVLIAMRGADQAWPDDDTLPREPDLWVVNKVDVADAASSKTRGEKPNAPLPISAKLGVGLDKLQAAVIARLGLADIKTDELWAFSDVLCRYCDSEMIEPLADYLNH